MLLLLSFSLQHSNLLVSNFRIQLMTAVKMAVLTRAVKNTSIFHYVHFSLFSTIFLSFVCSGISVTKNHSNDIFKRRIIVEFRGIL